MRARFRRLSARPATTWPTTVDPRRTFERRRVPHVSTVHCSSAVRWRPQWPRTPVLSYCRDLTTLALVPLKTPADRPYVGGGERRWFKTAHAADRAGGSQRKSCVV
jgi:hypothetical protein